MKGQNIVGVNSALAVKVIGEPFAAPCFTLNEAREITRVFKDSILEDGGPCIPGAFVYHPVIGLIAWVSSNCRVWVVRDEDQIGRGGLTEYPPDMLQMQFTDLPYIEQYRGFSIHKRTLKTHSCIVYKGAAMVKGIAGDIFADGHENAIEKARRWIDDQFC